MLQMSKYGRGTFQKCCVLLALIGKKHYNNNIMDELRKLLQENLNIEFISAVLSNPRQKEEVSKIKVRPLLKKEQLVFQLEIFRNSEVLNSYAGKY